MDLKKWDFGLCMLTEHRFFIPRPASSFNLRFHKGHFKFMATRGRGEGKIKSWRLCKVRDILIAF